MAPPYTAARIKNTGGTHGEPFEKTDVVFLKSVILPNKMFCFGCVFLTYFNDFTAGNAARGSVWLHEARWGAAKPFTETVNVENSVQHFY